MGLQDKEELQYLHNEAMKTEYDFHFGPPPAVQLPLTYYCKYNK